MIGVAKIYSGKNESTILGKIINSWEDNKQNKQKMRNRLFIRYPNLSFFTISFSTIK